jgi:hypothetical protein
MDEIADRLMTALRGVGVSDKALIELVARINNGDESHINPIARLDPEMDLGIVSAERICEQMEWRIAQVQDEFCLDPVDRPPAEGMHVLMPGGPMYDLDIGIAVKWLRSTLGHLGISSSMDWGRADPLDPERFRQSELSREYTDEQQTQWLSLFMPHFGSDPGQVAGVEFLYILAQQPTLVRKLIDVGGLTIIVQGIEFQGPDLNWGHLRIDFNPTRISFSSHNSLAGAHDGTWLSPIIQTS